MHKTVLAVDDSPIIIQCVTDALAGQYEVYGLNNGEAALSFVEDHTPDLFLFDIEMPTMNGFELATKIAQMKSFSHVPIIFITSHTSKDYMRKALSFYGNDFIIKPFTFETILSKVEKHLG